MYRTIEVRLPFDSSLIGTVKTYNSCCNDILKKAYKSKTRDKSLIHNLTYRRMRRKYPSIQSGLLQCARDQSMEMLKQCKYRTLPIKNMSSGIRYDKRNLSVNLDRGLLSISTIDGRKKYHISLPSYFKRYVDWLVDAATLRYSNGNMFLSLNCFKDDIDKREPKRVIGIDRGLRNIAVLSNNIFINSNHLTAVKRRYEHLRSILQQKGTRSANRKLNEISGSEKRFVKDANHCISKRIASMPASVFALEDLNINRSKRNGKLFNKSLNRWSFHQLEQMIAYKAEALGKHVVFVDPRNTSITCSKCGHADKESRKLSRFRCIKCGFDIDADLNAARNIAYRGKSSISRLQRRPMGITHSDRPSVTIHKMNCALCSISQKDMLRHKGCQPTKCSVDQSD